MPVVLGAAALLALVLVAVLLRGRQRTERELEVARTELASLRARMIEVEQRVSAPAVPAPEAAEYLITQVGEARSRHAAVPEGARIDRALFADLVLRESVVRAASIAHGLRTALAPETRNRIRFEMRREVRRARKVRRSEVKEARRAWESRQRAALDDEGSAA